MPMIRDVKAPVSLPLRTLTAARRCRCADDGRGNKGNDGPSDGADDGALFAGGAVTAVRPLPARELDCATLDELTIGASAQMDSPAVPPPSKEPLVTAAG
mmetsp:Transcript_27664/g.54016  ORF Transcript_27664/g.54016 Transcript_27664/m.54016 type:complete len:100 (+) Transcript_27664:700-999(+)